jgi:hypothetical protein
MSLDIPKILELQGLRNFLCKIIWNCALLFGMAGTPHPSDNAEVARRLMVLRQVVAGENQTAFQIILKIVLALPNFLD